MIGAVARGGAAAAILALAPATASTPGAADPPLYVIEFELAARQAGLGGRAELLAGGRLEMSSRRLPSGDLELRLARAIESPWKLTSADPVGPLGPHTKIAAVVTLPEATWEALAAERRAHSRLAAERYARWRPAAGRKPPLDGSFVFVVIGPAAGRFAVDVAADGEVRRVDNRMTDRWLNGEFGRFVGDWNAAGARPGAPQGYWFWNRGEPRPFVWQPATYRALAAALALLGPAPAEESATAAAAARLVRILAPRAPGGSAASSGPLPTERREEPLPAGETVVRSRAKGDGAEVEREMLRSAEGVVTADRLAVDLRRRGAQLRMIVSVHPAAEAD